MFYSIKRINHFPVPRSQEKVFFPALHLTRQYSIQRMGTIFKKRMARLYSHKHIWCPNHVARFKQHVAVDFRRWIDKCNNHKTPPQQHPIGCVRQQQSPSSWRAFHHFPRNRIRLVFLVAICSRTVNCNVKCGSPEGKLNFTLVFGRGINSCSANTVTILQGALLDLSIDPSGMQVSANGSIVTKWTRVLSWENHALLVEIKDQGGYK